ncbi:MAG: PEP-CTERM sorting domain-containing protein [Sedimentisphaerales bacterium]
MKTSSHSFCQVFAAVVVLVSLFSLPAQADYIYVSSGDKILKFDSSGNSTIFASDINGGGSGKLAFDKNGSLYMLTGNTISKFDSNGQSSFFVSTLNMNAFDLAFDSSNNLYVSVDNLQMRYDEGMIVKYDSSGNMSTFATGALAARSITLDNSDNLYISNTAKGTIEKFDIYGNRSTFASGIYVLGPLAFHSAGNLFVSVWPTTGNGMIIKFDTSGNNSIFASGIEASSLAFDSSDNLYAISGSTRENSSIVKFDSNGNMSIFATDLQAGACGIAIIPEPATLAFLSLGGLALLGRKRK